jgi:hypothetical protein
LGYLSVLHCLVKGARVLGEPHNGMVLLRKASTTSWLWHGKVPRIGPPPGRESVQI